MTCTNKTVKHRVRLTDLKPIAISLKLSEHQDATKGTGCVNEMKEKDVEKDVDGRRKRKKDIDGRRKRKKDVDAESLFTDQHLAASALYSTALA